MARGNPCGVCARHKRSRARLRVMRRSATSFTVSVTGTAATAPTPVRARAITPSIVSRLTNGRAPSCTSTMVTGRANAARPARTESARLDPPATNRSRSPASLPSQSGGWAACPGGSVTTTWSTCGWDRKGRSARNTIGTPRMGRNCFGSPGPARAPAPAATMTTATSGGEPSGEITDAVHADHLEPGEAQARARRHEPPAGSLPQPPLHARHGTDLPAQAHLPEEHGVRWQGAIVHARNQCRDDREIGRRLDQPHAPRDVHEHVQRIERQAAATLEHGEQDREAAVV